MRWQHFTRITSKLVQFHLWHWGTWCITEASPGSVLDFCCHIEKLLYDENNGAYRFGRSSSVSETDEACPTWAIGPWGFTPSSQHLNVFQGHHVKSPMFMHSHIQHRLDSLKFTAKVLLWTSRVQIKLNHKTKQNNSVMTALQKILYQRFYVFPKSTRCFWEENVYVFICPLWRPDLTEPSQNTEG